MSIYGTNIFSEQYINEGRILDKIKNLRDKRKNRKTVPKKRLNNKPQEQELSEERKQELLKIKELIDKKGSAIISKYNSSKEIKQEMIDLIEKAIKYCEENDNDWKEFEFPGDPIEKVNGKERPKVPKLLFNEFEFGIYPYNAEYIVEIIDASQGMRLNLLPILYKIGDELEEDPELNICVDYGDGDEGCLYITFK